MLLNRIELNKENSLGHAWELTEDGDIDFLASGFGYHNGPRCKKCGYSFCEHCQKLPTQECEKDEN